MTAHEWNVKYPIGTKVRLKGTRDEVGQTTDVATELLGAGDGMVAVYWGLDYDPEKHRSVFVDCEDLAEWRAE